MSGIKWLLGLVVAAAISFSPAVSIMRIFDRLTQDGTSNLRYVFVTGCVFGVAIVPVMKLTLKRIAGYFAPSKDEGGQDLYRLDHGILNVEVPPTSMWMNMGFWKVS